MSNLVESKEEFVKKKIKNERFIKLFGSMASYDFVPSYKLLLYFLEGQSFFNVQRRTYIQKRFLIFENNEFSLPYFTK